MPRKNVLELTDLQLEVVREALQDYRYAVFPQTQKHKRAVCDRLLAGQIAQLHTRNAIDDHRQA